jgi:hypothetical protein
LIIRLIGLPRFALILHGAPNNPSETKKLLFWYKVALRMNRIVRLFSLAAFVIGVLPSATIAGPSSTVQDDRKTHEAIKIYVKIRASDTISEAVENQTIGQLQKTKNVIPVADPDDADHIFILTFLN